MNTVGTMLKAERVAKGLTLRQVELGTKIRFKFLEAIEADDFTPMPSLSYAKGFVKNYAEFLGLSSATVLAFFRRQTTDVPKSAILPKGMSESLNRSFWQLTPGRFMALVLGGLALLFLTYFVLQYRVFQQPPKLAIVSPTENFMTTEKRLEVLGNTDSDATVTINGVSVLVRSDGRFFDQISLDPGVNKLTIIATSRLGKTTTVVREVGLQQP
jgi:cytoskeletal protein RodZ